MEKSGIIRSVGIVGSLTMVSRVLGLVRDTVMGGFFGGGLTMSAFVVAFTIPNLFRRLFGEGALSSAFIPVFVDVRHKEGDTAAWVFARKVITLLILTLLIISGVGIFLSTLFIQHPEWNTSIARMAGRPEMAELLTATFPLLRIMFPYVFFICLVALAMGILNSFHHFMVPAATPCLLNLIWIGGVLLVAPMAASTVSGQMTAIAWVIVGAGVIQLLAQFPMLVQHGYRPGLASPAGDARIGKVLTLMGPAALGMAVTQFNVVIDRILAAWVGPYAPAAMYFSERLIYLPLGIFATAMGTVLLPVLSGHAARKNAQASLDTVNHSLRLLLFFMVPAAAGLLVLAHPIIQMIFEWRAFDPEATWYTGTALQFYAPGLIVFSLAKVFVPVFYGHQDTKTPVKIGVGCVLLNFCLNVAFVLTWPQQYKHAGLACATVISEAVYAVVLGLLMHRRFGSPGWKSALAALVRALILAAAMAPAAWWSWNALAGLGDGKLHQVVAVLGGVTGGMLAYVVLAAVTRMREWQEIYGALKKRF